jgi:hypothetical protein
MNLSSRRLFVMIFLIALVALAARNITDPDFGWHLRTGEFIINAGTVPETDFFSFTAAGQPRIAHDWLIDALIYLLHQFGGDAAVIVFFALAGAAAFMILYLRCPGKPYFAAFIVLLAVITAAPFYGVRPQTISLLYFSAFLYLLDRYRSDGASLFLISLVPLMLLWTNSHGSFPLGPLLILVYLVANLAERWLGWMGPRDVRSGSPRDATLIISRPFVGSDDIRLFGLFLLCIGCIAINPHGLNYYLYPLETLNSSVIQTYIQEWQSPDFHQLALQPFAFMLVATLAVLAISRKRIGLPWLLLLFGLTYASLRSARQISLWVLVAAPILTSALEELGHAIPSARLPAPRHLGLAKAHVLNWILLALVVGGAALRIVSVVNDEGVAEAGYFPAQAVSLIESQGLPGRIFNQYEWGGYLIWKLYPRERVFIDGRSDLYGLSNDLVVHEYLKAFTGSRDWREPLERYDIRLVLIAPNVPLATLLSQDTDWEQLYTDSRATLFSRK